MSIDPTTLIATAAVGVALACCLFTITTLQRHNDRPNRLAAGAMLATVLGLACGPAVGAVTDDGLGAVDTGAAKATLVVMTVGLVAGATVLWTATQAFAGRRPMLGLAAGATAVAGVAALALAASSDAWALLPAACVAALGFAFATVELRRSSMAHNLNSVLLESSLWVAAGTSIVVAFLTGLDRISVAEGWAGLAGTCAALTLIAAMTLMALRVERYGNWWTLGEDLDRSALGVDELDDFLGQARDRIDRCRNVGQPVHVITTALPGLDELNLAYGHLAGDAALRWVAELLRRQAPPSAVLGHLGAGRFAIVTSREPELVANAVQNGMMRVPPPATLPVRLTPVFAWSSSDEAGFEFDLLRQTAEERLSHVS
ncbi:diguanylate cyclase [Nocardioides sp.]|uniref:diguanylate cyclase domain-containing protein n=1 Tax=Nocardioides sp. TaxID=35761 RepID=UPI0026370EA9|nr:diguanylate cyclase [Nocardioides sp.]